MSVKFKGLLVAGPPNSDESFTGYIVRMTEWNKYDRVSWILSRIGFSTSANYGCPLVFNKSTDLSLLAKLTGVSVSRLKPLLYPPAVSETGSRQLIFGLPVSRYMIQLKRTKLCPDCLRESNYHRKIWDLAPVTACPIHKCLLIDSCPQCSNAITWNRNALSVCECGHDWRKSTARLVKEGSLGLVQHIYHLCGYKIIGYQSNDTPRFNPLFSLTLEDFLSAVVFLAGQYCGVLSTAGKHLLPSRNNEELHGLLTQGFSAFDNWPQGYYEFLDWKRGNRQADVSGTGVKKDFGDFHHALRVVLTTSSFDFMRTAYGEYLNSMWDGGSLNTKTLRLVTIKPQEKRLLTKNEVVQLLGLTEDWINRLLRQDKLRPKVIHRQKVKLTLFARKEVESAKRYVQQLLSTNEVASLLHVGRVKVVDLVKEGCLTPAYGPVADGSKLWKFERNEVEGLNRQIEEKIVEPSGGAYTFLSLRTVTRIAGHARVGIGRIIKAVLTGEIHPCGKRGEQGLDRFIFSKEQISEYLKGLRQEFIGEAISLDEAATLIRVKKDQLYAFINHGLLVAHKSFTGRAETWVTTLEDVALFNSNYLIAAHVLEESGTSSELLVSALKDKGVHPVLGHKVKKRTQYVFRKADLKDLNLLEVIMDARVERDPKGQQYKIITGVQAAAMLSVTPEVIQELIDSGELQTVPCTFFRKSGDSNLFYRKDVLKIKEARTDNSKRVTLAEAARILGQDSATFTRQWVVTKRINELSTPAGDGKHYFLYEDVETLLKLKKKIIPSSEAAAVLGVGKKTLYMWTLSGKLNSFSGPHVDGYGYVMYLRSDIEKFLRLLRKKAKLISSPEAARLLGVTKWVIGHWTLIGKLKPVFGPQIDGSAKNLYSLKEVESILAQRQRGGRQLCP